MNGVRRRLSVAIVALLAITLIESSPARGQVIPAYVPAAGFPMGLESDDIGNVGAAGSSELSGTNLWVRGSGADIWDTSDEFHFAHTTVTGDFMIVAEVFNVDDVDRWTKAGLMIRDGLAPNARHAFLFATPTTEEGTAFQRRPVAGGITIHTAGPVFKPRVWLRLIRQGDVVAAAVRVGEVDPWIPVGEQIFDGLPRVVNVGLAVTSHRDGAVASALFAEMRLDSLDGFSTTWRDGDIGDVRAAGSATFDGRWTVNGSGADIWDTSDAFHFAWREVTGNFDFVAWVSFVEPIDEWTKAGLMLRESLAPDSRHAFILATPTTVNGIAFQRRVTSGDLTLHTAGRLFAPGIRLRMVRTGDVITAYYSHPIKTEDYWEPVGSETFSSLPATMLVGFAVTSHERGTLAQATFDDFTLNFGSPEWIGTDIGDVGAAGHSDIDEQSGPEFDVTGSGADVWGTSDAFRFLSREAVGDFDFSTSALALTDADRWTKVGLMMRDGLSPDARHAFILQTPTTEEGVAFQRRPVAGGESVHTPGPANAPEGFLRLVRRGDVITAYYKDLRANSWTQIGTETFTGLPATVRIGFAVTSHSYGVLATGEFSTLVLFGGIGP
jgi:hypothetical protein